MQEMNRKINNVLRIILQTRKYKCIYFRTCFGTNNVRKYYIYFNIQDN